MHWMLMPLRRYADFSGRSRRKEYWMFVLLNWLMGMGVLFLMMLLYAMGLSETAMMTVLTPVFALYSIVALAFVIPGLAVTVRRLHDTDRSGWNILFGLIPLVGPILLLIWYVTEGTRGPNRYGPDPVDDRMPAPAIA